MDFYQTNGQSQCDQISTPFKTLGIVDLLEADSRATFVLQVDQKWHSVGELQPISSNTALKSYNGLSKHLFDVKFDAVTELHAFARWIHSSSPSQNSTYRYLGIEWHRTVVANSWLVIGATRVIDPADIRDSVHTLALASREPPAQSFDWTQTALPVQCPEYAQTMRDLDWKSTGVGSMSLWSDELCLFFNSMLRTDVPQALYWGRDMTVIYNQAFIPIVGEKHPKILGQKAKVAWSEDWHAYGPLFEHCFNNAAAMETQQCMMLHRSGFIEETHFDYSILPVVGSSGLVLGLHTTVREITETILAERRLRAIVSVRESIAGCSTIDGLYQHFLKALETNKEDIAFAVIYAGHIDDCGTGLPRQSANRVRWGVHLKGSVGLSTDILPPVIAGRSKSEPLSLMFDKVTKSNRHIVLSKDEEALSSIRNGGILPEYGLSADIEQAVLHPLRDTTADETVGFLLIGLNSRRPYDQIYQQFTTNLTAQLDEALDSNITHLRELQQQQKQADIERAKLQLEILKQAREVKAMEQRFTRLTNISPVAINIARLDGSILYANNTWHKYFGEGPDSELAMSWLDKLYDEDLKEASRLWSGLETEGNVIDFEYRIKKPWVSSESDDVRLPYTWLMGNCYAEITKDGQTEVISTSIDVSHHKWISQESQKRTEEITNAKRQQDAFTDMVAHEMRNPLNAIIQCADIIQSCLTDVPEDVRQHESIQEIVENARTVMHCAMHQKHIIDDLLTLSKLDSDLLSFVPVKTEPVAIMTQVMKMFEAEAESHDISFTAQVDASITDLQAEEAMLDPQRVSQVLINLITNAVKFTRGRPERSIKVSIHATTDRRTLKDDTDLKYFPSNRKRPNTESSDNGLFFMFSVTDTGPGIPAAAESRLFKRFSQTSLKSHVVYGGSGLGLWISRELTEMQGGEIGFQSWPEGGTKFAFYVRASSMSSPAPDASYKSHMVEDYESVQAETATVDRTPDKSTSPKVDPAKENRDLKMINVLLTEDNLINQKVMKKQLEKIFKKVFIANNGQEALELMARTKVPNGTTSPKHTNEDVDIILMDIEMPVLNGVESTKAIRSLEAQGGLEKRIPIIAVSANARAEQIAEYREAGMDEALSKPFLMRDLISLVSRVL